MNDHLRDVLLSAYLDGEMDGAEAARAQEHLAFCGACRLEAERLSGVKKLLARAPRRAMPADLAEYLERRWARVSWLDTAAAWWNLRPMRVAAEMAAAALVAVSLWIGYSRLAPEETLPLEPLLAAHSRYAAEGPLPPGDMVASNFSDQMAGYHEQRPQ